MNTPLFNFFQGPFMKSGFSFLVYFPQSNLIEESVIPDTYEN